MPACARYEPEAVARGLGGADAPARRGGARLVGARGPQQPERQPGVARREMQPLAGLEVESGGGADRGQRARAQRLLQGPERLLVVARLDQDQPGRIKAELLQAVAMRPAVIGERAMRGDEEDGSRRWGKARQQGDEKAECRRRVAVRLRRHLVQGTDREAAVRQVRVDRGEPERQHACGAADALHARQQAAQFIDDCGAVSTCDGKRRGGHGYAVRTNVSDLRL